MHDPIGSNLGKILTALEKGDMGKYMLHMALLTKAVGVEAERTKHMGIYNLAVGIANTLLLAILVFLMARGI